MKNNNDQQMLMGFSYDSKNTVSYAGNYTLEQAANILCISCESVFWLVHQCMLNTILEEERLLIMYDSLQDYLELQRLDDDSIECEIAYHDRVDAHDDHYRNNRNAAQIFMDPSMTSQSKYGKWILQVRRSTVNIERRRDGR